MSTDEDKFVRQAVAKHPNTRPDTRRAIYTDDDY